MKNWKTPLLDIVIVLLVANLTVFYDDAICPRYWSYVMYSLAAALLVKAGSLAYLAKKK
ncbi:MAG: hypothetical protein LBI17_02100 [Rickettsiales bacterium]|jgi:hypothetical protein|nr:hypothetical protein [Rickettsiales bacterium]